MQWWISVDARHCLFLHVLRITDTRYAKQNVHILETLALQHHWYVFAYLIEISDT